MAAISAATIRAAMKDLTAEKPDQDWPFNREDLKIKLMVDAGEDTRRVNSVLRLMVKRGEVIADTEGGGYRYIPEAAPPATLEDQWTRVYRAARVAKGAFEINHIAKVAAITPARARNTLESLRTAGYVEGFRENDIIYYQATRLMRETPEVSLGPRWEKKRQISAGAALAELNRIFLTLDLAAPAVREQVKDQLKILNRRFGVNGESDDSGQD